MARGLSRTETLRCFRSDFARLLSCLPTLPQQDQLAIVYDAWTAKDLLAHIAAWDRELARGLDELLAGRRPSFSGYSEAAFNARAVAASRSVSLAAVLDELQGAHEQLMGQIEALSDAQWEQPAPFRWGDGTPMTPASVFDYRYRGETHYGGHAGEIAAWLERPGDRR